MRELKNINLDGVTIGQQLDKEREEEMEFSDAMQQGTDIEVIEEFWDTVQAKLGLMYVIRDITAEQVMKEYPKHLEKIKDRPRVKENE